MLSRPLLSLSPSRSLAKYPLNPCTNHQRLYRLTSPILLSSRALSFTRNDPPKPTPKPQPLAVRLLPASLQPDEQSSSSLKRIYQLALTEKKPLSIAIGLVSIMHLATLPLHVLTRLLAPRFFFGFNVCTFYNRKAHGLLYLTKPSKHMSPLS